MQIVQNINNKKVKSDCKRIIIYQNIVCSIFSINKKYIYKNITFNRKIINNFF